MERIATTEPPQETQDLAGAVYGLLTTQFTSRRQYRAIVVEMETAAGTFADLLAQAREVTISYPNSLYPQLLPLAQMIALHQARFLPPEAMKRLDSLGVSRVHGVHAALVAFRAEMDDGTPAPSMGDTFVHELAGAGFVVDRDGEQPCKPQITDTGRLAIVYLELAA